MKSLKKVLTLSLISVSFLTAENYPFNSYAVQPYYYNTQTNSAGIINQVASSIADQLGQNKDFYNIKDTPIGITSFVNIEDFSQSTKFGNVLSENLIHEMQVRGFKIIDFKTMPDIKIDAFGDYIFSRDVKKLIKNHKINYILSGTFTKYEDGLSINARLIELDSNTVMSSAQIFVPKSVVKSVNGKGDTLFKNYKFIEQKAVPSVQTRNTKIVENN
ncbi:MAG: hypothetical protein HXX81_04755 [Campylobacterales bacterium]|nr:hypothetical protein [Campylobacterales bacterium]